MALRVNSECWCEAGAENRSAASRCGDVATSICAGCGLALCDSHEICCPMCLGVTCSDCDHVCRLAGEPALTKAA